MGVGIGSDLTIGIGETHCWYQISISADGGPRQCVVHQPTSRLQALDGDSRRLGRQVPNPFVVDLIGPARLDQAVYGGLDDDVPEMKGVEDAGVEDGNRRLKRHSAV
jgi:hypothetical protein